MSILDRFHRGGKGKTIPANATFRITQTGQAKLQEFGSDPRSRVLVALESRGTSDIDEIAHASGLGRGQVERMVPSLVRGGYIQYVSAASDSVDSGGEG